MLKSNYVHPQSENIQELFRSRDPELILEGGYQAGKTYPCLVKLHLLHLRYPIWSLTVRKKKVDLVRTVIPDFENKVIERHPSDPESVVTSYGKNNPQWYDYPNGGRMVLGGMDDSDKVLGSSYDLIYFNQCEQASLDDWEKLRARCNGRSFRWITKNGRLNHQLLGDCNPDASFHWIKAREKSGRVRVIKCTLKDNPMLYYDGDWTAFGRKTDEDLQQSLTGIRYQRGYLGKWVSAEGNVYEFDENFHVIDTLPDIRTWRKYRGIDFGLVHPFVCLWFAKEPDTGALYCYREWRMTGMMVSDHAKKIKELSEGERISFTVADHDAEDNLTLNKAGVPTRLADKSILRGIEAVQRRLKARSIYFLRDALVMKDTELVNQNKPTSVIEEFGSYVHKPLEQHIGNSEKDDIPIKENDDGLDVTRYIVSAIDKGVTLGFHHGSAVAQTRL